MNEIIALTPEQRRQLFQEAASHMQITEASMEKDFWVCWTLERLFSLPGWKDGLTFKGGTSLSKAYNLIKRFSEDIDLVVDRSFLGYEIDEPLQPGISNRARNRWLDRLTTTCNERLRDELLPMLHEAIGEHLGKVGWTLQMAPEENAPEGNVLLFSYPAVCTPGTYVPSRIKLELVARTDDQPQELRSIQAYLYHALGREPTVVQIPTLSPVRTLWEKALLLHEEYHRPIERPIRPRLARHYYDLWAMLNDADLRRRAMGEGLEMLPGLVAQRSAFFPTSWAHYEDMVPGTLKIAPHPERTAYWEGDYADMEAEMIFGERPSFAAMMEVVQAFQNEVNRKRPANYLPLVGAILLMAASCMAAAR